MADRVKSKDFLKIASIHCVRPSLGFPGCIISCATRRVLLPCRAMLCKCAHIEQVLIDRRWNVTNSFRRVSGKNVSPGVFATFRAMPEPFGNSSLLIVPTAVEFAIYLAILQSKDPSVQGKPAVESTIQPNLREMDHHQISKHRRSRLHCRYPKHQPSIERK